MKKTIILILISIFTISCGSYKIEDFMRSRNEIVNASVNKNKVYFTWISSSNISIFTKDDVKAFFNKNPNLTLDESSFRYVNYNGKQVIESFEYTGIYRDEKAELAKLKKEQNEIAIISKIIKSATFKNNLYTVNNSKVVWGPNDGIESYGRGNYIHNLTETSIRNWFASNPEYVLEKIDYAKHQTTPRRGFFENYISSFSFYKTDNQQLIKEQKCKEAIVDAHRGMPSPNLSRKNIEKAISFCKECCNDELEASFYKDVPYLKREVFLEYFPNSKYNAKIRQDIADLQSGKKREVGMIDALGQAYNNSAVGQSIKEIGKNMPASNSETNNTSNSSNYEIIEQVNVKRFEFTTEQGQINASSFNLSVGCNDYSHQYNEDSSKFSIQYLSGDTNFRTNTDIASFNNEIENKYFSQQDGAFVTIVFYNKNNEIVVLKLKFKTAGYYRLEIFPN